MHFWSYSVQYGPIWSTSVNFYSIRSDLVHIGPIRWLYLVQFGSIRSILSTLVLFGHFGPIQSTLVKLGPLYPLPSFLVLFCSIRSTAVHSVLFQSTLVLCSPFGTLWFYSVLSVLFGPLWSYLVHFTELWSYSIHLVYSFRFGPLRSYSVQFVPTLSTLVHSIIFGPNQFTSVTKQFFYLGSAQSHIKWTEAQAQHITSLNRLEFFFTGPNPNPTISNNAFQLQILTCSHKVQNETAATSENEAMWGEFCSAPPISKMGLICVVLYSFFLGARWPHTGPE